jgi:hypothetical protein
MTAIVLGRMPKMSVSRSRTANPASTSVSSAASSSALAGRAAPKVTDRRQSHRLLWRRLVETGGSSTRLLQEREGDLIGALLRPSSGNA